MTGTLALWRVSVSSIKPLASEIAKFVLDSNKRKKSRAVSSQLRLAGQNAREVQQCKSIGVVEVSISYRTDV